MLYLLRDENNILAQDAHPDEQASRLNLWSELDIVSENSEQGQLCPECKRRITVLHWGPERITKLTSTRFPDMIIYDNLILSERVKNAIEENGLKGILSYEKIEVTGKYVPPFDYYYTKIAFAENKINWKNSKIKKKDIKKYSDCELCGCFVNHAAGIELYEEYYSEYDIFQLYCMPHRFIVSERFCDIACKNGFLNMNFVRMSKYSF